MPTFAVPLPDLVRFNHRIHDRIDPWFARRWVRRAAWLLLAGFLVFALVWICFADRPADVGKAARLPAAAADQRARL